MPSVFFKRTALIALALSLALAACVFEHAQNPLAQPVPNADTLHPAAITCAVAVPGAVPGTIIPVPAGEKPTDICPRTAITYIFFSYNHSGNTKIPVITGAAPAADAASLQMEQDNLARMQLDNLAALKLQNKAPGQTQGQPP